MNTILYINMKSLIIELLIINAIASAILVIIAKNPVISVIYLISLILNAALFLIVKGMPFIGIAYILIYLGAIIVLFLFVIMMINVNLTDILDIGSHYTKNIPLALIVSGLFLYELFNVLPSYLNNLVLPLDNSLFYTLILESVLLLNNFTLDILSHLGVLSTESLNLPELGGISNSINNEFFPLLISNNWPETLLSNFSHILSIAYSLYTYGAFLFLLTSIILLLALISPIYLSGRS